MKNKLSLIVFWGAIWGLEEATLGHLLHILTLNLGWLLWFPLAYFFLSQVYKGTHEPASVILTSLVAAAVKLVNIWMTPNLLIVICPAVSVIAEGLAFFLVFKALKVNGRVFSSFTKTVLSSFLWRVFYVAAIMAVPSTIMPVYPYGSFSALSKFVLFEGLINSSVIIGLVYLGSVFTGKTQARPCLRGAKPFKFLRDLSIKPVASLCLFAVALFMQTLL